MVPALLQFKAKIDKIISECFGNNPSFTETVKKMFESAVHKRPNKPAEQIAKHIDGLMKAKGKSDAELEVQLDDCLVLFKFVSSKDVFEAFYKKDLAKRLLQGRSSNLDIEKSMLQKLKSGTLFLDLLNCN